MSSVSAVTSVHQRKALNARGHFSRYSNNMFTAEDILIGRALRAAQLYMKHRAGVFPLQSSKWVQYKPQRVIKILKYDQESIQNKL